MNKRLKLSCLSLFLALVICSCSSQKKYSYETVPDDPLKANIETLRRSMIPTQLCQVKGNTGYAPSFGIFEIGHVIDGVDENKLAKEHKKLCVTLFSKVDNVETLYFRLRDMLCVAVSDILHKDLSFHAMTATHSYEHPKNLNAIV